MQTEKQELLEYQKDNKGTVIIVDDESLFNIECYVQSFEIGVDGDYFDSNYGNYLNDDGSEIEIYPIGLNLETNEPKKLSFKEINRAENEFLEQYA